MIVTFKSSFPVVSIRLEAQQGGINHVPGMYPQNTLTGDREDGRGNLLE